MASSIHDDSSSSDEDDHMSKIREAICSSTSVQKKHIPSKEDICEKKTTTGRNRHLPSKRPDKDESEKDEELYNFLQTTPGFRKHVANKLSQSLDSELDASGTCFKSHPSRLFEQKTDEEDTGVRLFGSSNRFLSDTPVVDKPAKRPRQVSSSSTDSSEDERLAEASVSHDFVMQQSSVPFHALRTPADIVISDRNAIGDSEQNSGSTSVSSRSDKDSNSLPKLSSRTNEHDIKNRAKSATVDSGTDRGFSSKESNNDKYIKEEDQSNTVDHEPSGTGTSNSKTCVANQVQMKGRIGSEESHAECNTHKQKHKKKRDRESVDKYNDSDDGVVDHDEESLENNSVINVKHSNKKKKKKHRKKELDT